MSRKKSRVPTSRIGRLARLGVAAGELAVGGVTERVKRIARDVPEDAVNVFLTATNAEKLARRLANMRGAAMKMGQVLSMEGAEILPPEFTKALAILRDSANTMPEAQVRKVLVSEYGKDWASLFERFEFEPIAAASIGQVHRATARDGRDLALKIQYPGVARSIDSDVDNMALFMRMANILPVEIDIDGIVEETKRQLRQEADYLVEAKYLRDYRELVSGDPEFLVPAARRLFVSQAAGMAALEASVQSVLKLKGTVEVTVGEHVNRLGPGQSLHFNSGVQHHMRNISKTDAELVVVVYNP